MRNKSIKWMSPISIILALTFIFGTASHAFAQPPAQAEKVEVLVSFTEKPGPAEQALIQNEGGKVKHTYHIVPTIAASIPKGKLDSLRRKPKVAYVEEDVIVQVIADPLPWGVERIEAGMVHSQYKGQGIKIAVLDSGIDLDHPDLRIAGDVTFVPGTTNGDDDYGHGTMVAGIIAALDNDIGMVGVAPEASLYAVKVLDQNGSSVSGSVLSGIEWAIDNNMQVINMSFGSFLNFPQAVQAALDKAYQEGIVLVAGAGNGGDQGTIFSPARCEPVISVGATDQQDARASFSCTGSTLELMAPGIGILSTSRGGGHSSGSGTSFSTPHVTGVAALLIDSGVTSNVKVRQLLRGTAEDLGPSGFDSYYGCGLVNAARATGVASNNESGDTIPPITTIELSGLKGNGDWYRSDVTVGLTAEDNPGGSGVAKTEYSLDDGKTWHTYTSPFTITTELTRHTVLARSWDNAGNDEGPPVFVKFRIDKTPPTVTLTADLTEIGGVKPNHMVWVNYSGTVKESGSRLSATPNIVLVDEYGELDQNLGSRLSGAVAVEAWCNGNDKDGRTYIIRLSACDTAGNETTVEVTITVLHKRDKKKTNN